MSNTIYASFGDANLAEKAVGALLDRGFNASDISVVHGQGSTTDANAAVMPTSGQGYDSSTSIRDRTNDASDAMTETSSRAYDAVERRYDTDLESNARTTPMDTNDIPSRPLDVDAGRDPDAASYMRRPNDPNQPVYTEPDLRSVDPMVTDTTIDPNRTGYGDTASRTEQVNRDIDFDGDDDLPRNDIETSAKSGITTTTPGDAGAGAIKGTGWGLGVGAVAALASLMVPGVGLVVGGGALAAALGGVAAAAGAGAVAGAVTGYLKDQGVDDHVAEHYETAVRGGGALLAVSVPSGNVGEVEAREILNKYGASNINSFASANRGYVS